MIYWVGTIANINLAVWSNSAVRFSRLVVYFRPFGFYLFGRPVSAVWARLIPNLIQLSYPVQQTSPLHKC